ncbi:MULTISPECIES: FadR/GntR family transcriptional regulator [Larsenimonas]|uniref:FadR/GntR family transcriptional regulator n=1 Tax=Larsenimonas suaedae TaxID=1851019 RepID=A0ABU1GSP3_9GAMM|nr:MULTISPECIES: FadR/GntR family transcriptional regulator [Larsenimonas]MCM2972205.1 FadR family transcriptional regulator [Larsenimonas suaedae]MCM5704236.1 FadR family transcriptional regulator [Larsenimonas salina]MDR5894999.1 FadR/GntR family transcriptional regulator [Larsenimonas suaedae]
MTEKTKALNLERINQQGSLSSQIARQLEALINSGQIEVGEKLPTESKLCDLFGVSRTAVREAIAHLRSMGLIETRRGVGTRVLRTEPERVWPAQDISATTVEDILFVLELRVTVEPRAAELAASRHTDEDARALQAAHDAFVGACHHKTLGRGEDYAFHHAIIQATHNPCFLAFYDPLHKGAIPRAQLLNAELDTEAAHTYLEHVAVEHKRILDAILARDPEGAFQAMEQHLLRATQTYRTYLPSD